MNKELPFFKFTPTEWLVGKISYQALEVQGAFIQCCCMFWKQNGTLLAKDIDWKIGKENLKTLIDFDFIKEVEGELKIDFLEHQLIKFQGVRKARSESGAAGGVAKASNLIANATPELASAKQNVAKGWQNLADIRHKTKDNIDILNNTLLSEIKISDDKKKFLVRDISIDVTPDDITYFQIAIKFQEVFIKNLSDKGAPFITQQNATYKNYVTPIRHMMTIDMVTIEQMREAIRYLKSPQGEFWKSVILSTKKLRQQIATIIAKKNEQKPGTAKPIRRD